MRLFIRIGLTAAAAMLIPAANISLRAAQGAQAIKIAAHRFAFAPNEVTLKVHEPALLVFNSDDVTHGMHFDDLDINITIPKGSNTEVRFTPEKPGDFVGHCAVFCGTGHGNMTLTIHVVE